MMATARVLLSILTLIYTLPFCSANAITQEFKTDVIERFYSDLEIFAESGQLSHQLLTNLSMSTFQGVLLSKPQTKEFLRSLHQGSTITGPKTCGFIFDYLDANAFNADVTAKEFFKRVVIKQIEHPYHVHDISNVYAYGYNEARRRMMTVIEFDVTITYTDIGSLPTHSPTFAPSTAPTVLVTTLRDTTASTSSTVPGVFYLLAFVGLLAILICLGIGFCLCSNKDL